ncbi:3-deoxy-manno-octulosonate cytidylyltransferase [Verrucomicrobia bacterium LW23]|nr:3-deoxy-manno-octulosonate cytidylyltransferase [Verrucomicrobia bacterium LW23]
MSRSLIVIPSRYGSTRFPGKSLALIAGKPLVQWVWESVSKSATATQVVVATDDARIADAVAAFGGTVVMTSPDHCSGTDRMAEVASKIPADIYVNVQGDEPLLPAGEVDALIEGLAASPATPMATLAHRIHDEAEWRSPEVVKVVTTTARQALYFSRSPLPFARAWSPSMTVWRHVGIYAFRAQALTQFVSWAPSMLETTESLEQLRALENGMPILVLPTQFRCRGVDRPEDVPAVEAELLQRAVA